MSGNAEAVEKLAIAIRGPRPVGENVVYSNDRALGQRAWDALQADPLAYVKPKPLEWIQLGYYEFNVETIFGNYRLRGHKLEGYCWSLEMGKWSNIMPLEAAQAAAYDDMCNRVKELF